MSSQTLESMLGCTKAQQVEKKPRPSDQQALKCPRCDSTNTKFCYYNNYSLSQPRYFCKSCRRYWTKGGTLRNVPVGGGCRKNKRSSAASSSSKCRSQDQSVCSSPSPLPPSLTALPYEASDLSLALARLQKQHPSLGVEEHVDMPIMCNPNSAPYDILGNHHHGFLETPNAGLFHSLYYGNLNLGGPHVESSAVGEMGVPYDDHLGGGVAPTAVKQEICGGSRDQQGENRVLYSFPWQQTGDHQGNNMGDHQMEYSSKQNWQGFGSSPSWHGIINSPLM